MNKEPVILSFPHSGTHLIASMFSLRVFGGNSFSKKKKRYNLRDCIEFNKNKKIASIHSLKRNLQGRDIEYLMLYTKPIFLIRDPKDVFASIHMRVKSENFLESARTLLPYKMNPIGSWSRFLYEYMYDDVLIVRYENIINHYEIESKRIEGYASKKVSKEIPKLANVPSSRKGIVGDYVNILTKEEADFIDNELKDEINLIDSFLY